MARQITDKDILIAKEKYKSLSKKEKVNYIWEYYRFHILAGIIAIVMVGSIINTTIINPPKKSGLNITFMDAPIHMESLEAYIPIFNELFIEDNEKYEVTTYEYYLGTDDAQYTAAALQKIMAQIQVAELDVIVAHKDTFYGYAMQGVFYDLDTVEINFGSQTKEYIQSEYDTEKKAYGISLLGCELFRELGFIPDEYLVGIVVNTGNLEVGVKFINYALSSAD